jgi:hypothetical protein
MNHSEGKGDLVKTPALDLTEPFEQEIQAGKYRERDKKLAERQQPERGPVLHLGFEQYKQILEI